MADREREALRMAAQNYMAAFGQALEAHGIPYGPQQKEADEQLRAALSAPQHEAPQWVAVSERLPELGAERGGVDSVLVMWRDECIPDCGSQWMVACTAWVRPNAHYLSHWMPLPQQPESGT
jgi:hypothetical protein